MATERTLFAMPETAIGEWSTVVTMTTITSPHCTCIYLPSSEPSLSYVCGRLLSSLCAGRNPSSLQPPVTFCQGKTGPDILLATPLLVLLQGSSLMSVGATSCLDCRDNWDCFWHLQVCTYVCCADFLCHICLYCLPSHSYTTFCTSCYWLTLTHPLVTLTVTHSFSLAHLSHSQSLSCPTLSHSLSLTHLSHSHSPTCHTLTHPLVTLSLTHLSHSQSLTCHTLPHPLFTLSPTFHTLTHPLVTLSLTHLSHSHSLVTLSLTNALSHSLSSGFRLKGRDVHSAGIATHFVGKDKVSMSACQHVSTSARQHISMSACQHVSTSARQHVSMSARQHVSMSACSCPLQQPLALYSCVRSLANLHLGDIRIVESCNSHIAV